MLTVILVALGIVALVFISLLVGIGRLVFINALNEAYRDRNY